MNPVILQLKDITYQLLDNDPKNMLFERWCRLINFFDHDIHFQWNYGNMEIDKEEYSREFTIKKQEDAFNVVRKEYSDMLVSRFAKGTNNLKKERYLTYGIHATDYKSAKRKFNKITKNLEKHFKKLGSKLGVNEPSAFGFLSTIGTSVPTFEMMDKMDKKGIVLNSAFAVSASFAFVDHLAFTVSFNEKYIFPMIVGKLISGILAVIVANILFARRTKNA